MNQVLQATANVSQTASPTISVVVCSFNRAEGLRSALASLYALETGNLFSYEIVVIDNASTDATPATIAAAAAESKTPLRGVYEGRKGIAPARNRGIAEAKGEWVAFFDDDQRADPNWLKELLPLAKSKKARCVGGAVVLELPAGHQERKLGPACRMLLGEALWSTEPMEYTQKIGPGAGNWMIHKSLLAEVGIFDERISGRGEDTDLYCRIRELGEACWFAPTAIIHHIIPAARMEEAFFQRLSKNIGEGVAAREYATFGVTRFGFVWGAKLARALLVDGPLALYYKAAGRHEIALERTCRVAIERGHFWQGWKLLSTPAVKA